MVVVAAATVVLETGTEALGIVALAAAVGAVVVATVPAASVDLFGIISFWPMWSRSELRLLAAFNFATLV